VYQVHFELSGNSPLAWRDFFGRESNDLNPKQEAGIDGRFLVTHCALEDLASKYLPALKKEMQTTNVAYEQFAQEIVREEKHRGDAWKEERNTVGDIATLLQFE
jgi:hypothetical protein